MVGSSFVRNEVRFGRQALLNMAAGFCDCILVADHQSDGTPEIQRELPRERAVRTRRCFAFDVPAFTARNSRAILR